MRRSDGKRHWFKGQDKFRDWEVKIHRASLEPDPQLAFGIREKVDQGAFIIDNNGFFTRSFSDQAAIDWVRSMGEQELAATLTRDR